MVTVLAEHLGVLYNTAKMISANGFSKLNSKFSVPGRKPWSANEDKYLINSILACMPPAWSKIAKGLSKRNGKKCFGHWKTLQRRLYEG